MFPLLKANPDVIEISAAPVEVGGWGATIV